MKTQLVQTILFLPLLSFFPNGSFAQGTEINTELWYTQPGIIGTILLCIVVLIVISFILTLRIKKLLNISDDAKERDEIRKSIHHHSSQLDNKDLHENMYSSPYQVAENELARQGQVVLRQGFVQKITHNPNFPLVDEKKMGKIKVET